MIMNWRYRRLVALLSGFILLSACARKPDTPSTQFIATMHALADASDLTNPDEVGRLLHTHFKPKEPDTFNGAGPSACAKASNPQTEMNEVSSYKADDFWFGGFKL
jgi:hypothetical protein